MIVRDVASRVVFREEKMGKADLLAGDSVFAGLNCFEPGQEHQLHTHPGQDKLYYVIEGEGDVTVAEETSHIKPGDLVLAKDGVPHALANPGPARLVVMTIMAPPPARK